MERGPGGRAAGVNRAHLPFRSGDAGWCSREGKGFSDAQVPASMVFEGGETEPPEVLEAGGELPGVGVAILNGAKQKAIKGHLGGQKQDYCVIQRVWFCPQGGRSPPC